MSRYKIAKEARHDLKEIYRHIVSANPPAAGRLHDLSDDKFRMLAENPLLGERREDLAKNLRMFTIGNYVILIGPRKNALTSYKSCIPLAIYRHCGVHQRAFVDDYDVEKASIWKRLKNLSRSAAAGRGGR